MGTGGIIQAPPFPGRSFPPFHPLLVFLFFSFFSLAAPFVSTLSHQVPASKFSCLGGIFPTWGHTDDTQEGDPQRGRHGAASYIGQCLTLKQAVPSIEYLTFIWELNPRSKLLIKLSSPVKIPGPWYLTVKSDEIYLGAGRVGEGGGEKRKSKRGRSSLIWGGFHSFLVLQYRNQVFCPLRSLVWPPETAVAFRSMITQALVDSPASLCPFILLYESSG